MERKMISSINVTPFVDVMLVLLVVFMITAPMLLPTVEVDLPKTVSKTNQASEDKSTVVVITVTKSSEIYVQDKLVKLVNIKSEMDEYLAKDKNVKVFLKGDKNVSYDTIIHTLVAIKNAGLRNVSLVTSMDFS